MWERRRIRQPTPSSHNMSITFRDQFGQFKGNVVVDDTRNCLTKTIDALY